MAKQKNNVILIGMPTSGKSTIGVILAKALGYSFVDTDIVIQENEKRLLRDIIGKEGVGAFLKMEEKANLSLDPVNAVIATGGSAVYSQRAMEHFRSIGTVIYLDEKIGNIKKHLYDLDRRGVIHRRGQTIDDIYAERSPLYEKFADMTIEEEGRPFDDIVMEIYGKLTDAQ